MQVGGNLKEVILPDLRKIEYVVDGRNRRVARREYAWDGQGQAYVLTDERRWLWQGQLRIVAELDGDGEFVKRFVYGTKVNVPEYMVTYDPVSHLETGTYRILTDQLGSLRLVVDASSGTVVQRMRHDEWGNVLEDTTPGLVPFGFAGGLYDPATGLVRFGARDYDPETGRWTGKDPILFSGGSACLYRYVADDPVNLIDPRGLKEPTKRLITPGGLHLFTIPGPEGGPVQGKPKLGLGNHEREPVKPDPQPGLRNGPSDPPPLIPPPPGEPGDRCANSITRNIDRSLAKGLGKPDPCPGYDPLPCPGGGNVPGKPSIATPPVLK